jgi:hypothetical protein
MDKLSVDEFLLLVEKTNFRDLFSLCSSSKRIKDLCIQNKDYIVRIFLKKIYSDAMINLLLDINNSHDIFHMNKVVQKYFNNINTADPEEFAEIFQNTTMYITKTNDIYLGYKTYILPLPDSYYDKKINVRLYIDDEYVKFDSTLKSIAAKLIHDKNARSKKFDILIIDTKVPEYKILSDEIKNKTEIIEENFKKGSSIYNSSMEKIKHLKNLLKVTWY